MRTVFQVTWNTATKWGSHAINGLIGVLLVPFLLNELGKEGYGVIALVGVILSMTGLADLGFRQGLGRNLAEALAHHDNQRFNELISSAMVVYIAIGLLLSCVLIGGAPYIVPIFKISPALTPPAIFLVRWYGSAAVISSFVNPVFTSTLISHNRYDISNNIFTAVYILRGIGLFCVLGLTQAGLYGWGIVFITATALGTMARIFIAIGFKPDLQIRLRHFKTDALKQLFSLGSKMYVFNLAELISVQANPIIITHFFGPASVSIYKPGQILTEHSNQFVTAFRGQLFPLTTGYHTAGNITKLQEILIKATRYSTLMAVAVSVMLVVFAEPIMKVWIGGTSIGQYYQTAAWILSLSAISSMLNSAGGSQWAVLLGMNRLKFLIWIASISGILNVLFSIYLVGYTSLGIIGVVVPTVILAAIRRPIIAVYTARACQLSPKRFLCETYIRPILVLLLLGIIALGARLRFQPDSVFAIAACLAITAAAWFPLCWFIGLEASDRKTLINLATRFREKKDSI